MRKLTDISAEKKLIYIPTSEIFPHPDNPRKEFGDLKELAESIKANGIMQNLTVVCGHGDYSEGFTVIIGHRRLSAAKLAGLEEVPCVVVDMTPEEQVATMLLENMQRSDLTPYEQAQGFQMMIDFGESVNSICEKTGFSQSTVRRRLKIAELDGKTLQTVSATRQISIMDLDKLSEIEDVKTRNLVLCEIGTKNFENRVAQALDAQKLKRDADRWREALLARGAIEIAYNDCWNGKYKVPANKSYIETKNETSELDGVFEKGKQYYFAFLRGSVYIREDRDKEEDEARNCETARKEAERKALREKLGEAFKRAYRSRLDFIKKKICSRAIGMHVVTAIEFAYKRDITSLPYSNLGFINAELLSELLGVDFEEGKRDAAVITTAMNVRLQTNSAIAYTYAKWEDEGAECCNWNGEYQESVRLVRLYEFLCKIGYEMSDEERDLLDGTSDLYKTNDQ